MQKIRAKEVVDFLVSGEGVGMRLPSATKSLGFQLGGQVRSA